MSDENRGFKNIKKFFPDILSFIFLAFALLLNRFWMLSDLAFSLFRGVPNFYSWIVLWNCRVLETLGFSGYWAGNAMIPYKNVLAFSENMIGLTPLVFPLRLISDNPVLIVNLLSLIMVFLTMIILFLILKKWTGSRVGSLIGTLLFALYPWSMKEFSLGRFHMLAVFFIPLIFYLNVKFWNNPKKKYLIFFFILFLWTFLSNIYLGIFMTLFIGLFNLIWYFYEKQLFSFKKIFKWSLTVFLIWLFMIPLFLKYREAGSDIGMIRTLQDQVNYTGPLNSWLTVPDENFLYGKIVRIFPKGTRDGIVENYMFPGMIALIFFLLSFFYKKFPKWLKSLRLTGLFMVILSLGPYIPGLTVKIPLPFSLFWYIFPPLQATRNPHRFALFAIFTVAVMAAFMMRDFLKRNKKNVFFAFIIIFFILFETQSIEKSDIAIEKYSKQFYKWLNAVKNNHIVAELPFEIHTDLRAMASATFFWHKTINGVSGLRPPLQSQLERELINFPSEHTINILQALNVDRIVVNERAYGKRRRKMLKSMESFHSIRFLFRIGMKSAWSVSNGEKFDYFVPKDDLYLERLKTVEGYKLFINVKNPKKKIIFNPKAPSKFKFTKSREWEVTVFSNDKGKGTILKKMKWNPPALFYDKNSKKEVLSDLKNNNRNDISVRVDIPGESILLRIKRNNKVKNEKI